MIISEIDKRNLILLRKNVDIFLSRVTTEFIHSNSCILDVAPQDHAGIMPFVNSTILVETLDIDPSSNSTYISDICTCAHIVGLEKFDHIICTEVLEHTRQPFDAVENIYKMLKPGGCAFVSTPFNFRIHGPLPDCWRFTKYGLEELFKKFEIIELNELKSDDRELMPIQYTLIAKKPLSNSMP